VLNRTVYQSYTGQHISQSEAATTAHIRADISVHKRQRISVFEGNSDTYIYQQGLLGLCQVRVNLASSLRAEFSWWMFVSDLTLLMQ
jgi:hypothetical protein